MIYPLAALLVYAAVRMLRGKERQTQLRREGLRAVHELGGAGDADPAAASRARASWSARTGGWMATPLLVALAVIETTDLVFAVDSIPRCSRVTRDPFLVYTSNIFALLGLRSLYFLLAGVIRKLRFLRIGLAVMLLLAAAKLALGDLFHVPPLVSLRGHRASSSASSIAASLLFPGTEKPSQPGAAPTAIRSRTCGRTPPAARNA